MDISYYERNISPDWLSSAKNDWVKFFCILRGMIRYTSGGKKKVSIAHLRENYAGFSDQITPKLITYFSSLGLYDQFQISKNLAQS